IGVAVTSRGKDAVALLKRLLEAKGNQLKSSSFDDFGNISFGILEHIDIPGIKYDPKIGILGLDVAVSMTRPGFNIRLRSKHKARIGKSHKITSDEAKEFLSREFGVRIV
ncbi:MAG TPA: 50S ribosomal protein L5, partial [Nitrosopumilaceae archaeon]|nr:50S ribosomal protein L5 [Nitrosopumilaceae archaeon]